MTTDQLPRWPLLDDYRVPGLLLLLGFGVLLLPAVVLLARRCAAGFRSAAGVGLEPVARMLVHLAAIGRLVLGMGSHARARTGGGAADEPTAGREGRSSPDSAEKVTAP